MGNGGFAKLPDIDKVSPPKGETIVYAPVLRKKNASRDPHTPRPGESDAIAEWRRWKNSPSPVTPGDSFTCSEDTEITEEEEV